VARRLGDQPAARTAGAVRFPGGSADPRRRYHRRVYAARETRADAIDPGILAFIERMPKAELHLHLDGSLRPETALQLARERGLDETLDSEAMRARLIGPAQAADQEDLLRAFDLPIRLMQDSDALERVAFELVEDVTTDATRYVEVRWAPGLHTDRGLGLREGIDAVVRGTSEAARSTGVVARLIACALRSHPPELNATVAREAARFVGAGLTGFDLAGREAAFPDPLLHADAFAIARGGGLGITIHAGEWGGAAQVRRAVDLDPVRIAHGSPAGDDPGLQRQLIDRGITLDLAPTSNAQAAIVPTLADHPLPRLLRAGVPVTLSTDDRTVSDLTLPREYARAHLVLGITLQELWAMDRHALEVAFLHHDEPLRRQLVDEFDAWAASEPLLASVP
jgi:adenosine deaminase